MEGRPPYTTVREWNIEYVRPRRRVHIGGKNLCRSSQVFRYFAIVGRGRVIAGVQTSYHTNTKCRAPHKNILLIPHNDMGFTANNLKGLGSVFGSPYGFLVSPGGSFDTFLADRWYRSATPCSTAQLASEVLDGRHVKYSMFGLGNAR